MGVMSFNAADNAMATLSAFIISGFNKDIAPLRSELDCQAFATDRRWGKRLIPGFVCRIVAWAAVAKGAGMGGVEKQSATSTAAIVPNQP